MTTMTTIKVSTEVRDQLNAMAAELGVTANSVVERLLAESVRRQRIDAALMSMSTMTAEESTEYMQEFALWDRSLDDNLEDDPWTSE